MTALRRRLLNEPSRSVIVAALMLADGRVPWSPAK